MLSSAAPRRPPSVVAAVSEALPEKAVACWEVVGFSNMSRTKGSPMHSPVIVELDGAGFGILAFWGGCKEAPDGHVSLLCRLMTDVTKPVEVEFSIKVIGADRARAYSTNHIFNTKEENWGWKEFLKLQELQAMCVNDSFFVELGVSMLTGQARSRKLPRACSVEGQTSGPDLLEAFSVDLASLLDSCHHSDVQLEGRGALAPIQAHRAILAARSPVFRRMLASGMQESGVGSKIMVADAEHSVVQEFVRFLYSGKVSPAVLEGQDMLCHLLALGHKYEVCSLVTFCTRRMAITEENAMECLLMAEQFHLESLKKQVMQFLCSCTARFLRAQKSEAFARLVKNYPELLSDLLERATEPPKKRAR